MKLVWIILLIFITVLLSGSIIVAQLAYRIEASLLSYRYTSGMLNQVIDPLDDAEIHRNTVRGAFRYIRKQLSMRVPVEIEPHIIHGSMEGFSAEWFQRTADRMLYSVQLVLNGREKHLTFPLSLGGFKSAFLNSARTGFSTDEYLEIERSVRAIPSNIELADEIPEDAMNRIIRVLGNVRFFLILLQYVTPAVFIILCFVFRRIGSGFTAVGAGLLIGGTAISVLSTGFADTVARSASSGIAEAVPDFMSWVQSGTFLIIHDLVQKLIPVSLVVAVIGLGLIGLGVPLIIYKQDPEIRWGGEITPN